MLKRHRASLLKCIGIRCLRTKTSKKLAESLVPYVARELNAVYQSRSDYASLKQPPPTSTDPSSILSSTPSPQGNAADPRGNLEKVWHLLKNGKTEDSQNHSGQWDAVPEDLDADPSIVAAAVKKGFLRLDNEIVHNPLKTLLELEVRRAALNAVKDGKVDPEKAKEVQRMGFDTQEKGRLLEGFLPALSGSCGLVAFLDTARNK